MPWLAGLADAQVVIEDFGRCVIGQEGCFQREGREGEGERKEEGEEALLISFLFFFFLFLAWLAES